MKKLLFALLLSVLVIACAATTVFADPVTITYSYWGTPDEAASVQAVADKFNAEHPDIKVEVMAIPNEEYVTKLNTMAAAGELPDCGIMSESGVLDFAEKGLLADISGMYEGKESMPLDSITFEKDGAPVADSGANEILLLYYNKDMFDAAGLEYPSASEPMAWDEFVALAKKLTIDANGKTAEEEGFDANNIVQYGYVVDNWTWQPEVWALSNGGRWISEDGKEVVIKSPETIESIQKVADLTLVEHVMPYNAGLEDNGIQRSIVAGNVAMATGGAWNVGTSLPGVPFKYGEFISWYMQEENSWNLIETGIWMPILEEWYTNPEKTAQWIENPNFPPAEEYKPAVVEFAMEKAISANWYYAPHMTEFDEYLRSILGPVWDGSETAEEAINNGYDYLCTILAGE